MSHVKSLIGITTTVGLCILPLFTPETVYAQQNQKPLPVTVVNPLPLPVADVTNVLHEPFQVGTIYDTLQDGAGEIVLVTVPVGERLVIEYVSAAVNAREPDGLGEVTLYSPVWSMGASITFHPTGATGNGLNHWWACATPIKYIAEPGTDVTLRVRTIGPGGTFRGFISGYYVRVP